MVFGQSYRFYLLFQHGTTPNHAEADGYIVNHGEQGPASVHFLTQLGPSVAVVAPDSRTQRSRKRIIPPAAMQRIKVAVRAFPVRSRRCSFV
jgi:hypothetical protein